MIQKNQKWNTTLEIFQIFSTLLMEVEMGRNKKNVQTAVFDIIFCQWLYVSLAFNFMTNSSCIANFKFRFFVTMLKAILNKMVIYGTAWATFHFPLKNFLYFSGKKLFIWRPKLKDFLIFFPQKILRMKFSSLN